MVATPELDPTRKHNATAAREEFATCEREAAQRTGIIARVADDSLDDLPRNAGGLHDDDSRLQETQLEIDVCTMWEFRHSPMLGVSTAPTFNNS